MDTTTIQAKDLLKTTGIFKATLDMTLSQALPKLTRTHDALFVFNERGKYQGVINPYYTAFQSNYPPETKLAKCLYKAPALASDTIIWDIARLMHESKIYYLPVINHNAFIGIVTINRILHALEQNGLTKRLRLIRKKRIVTVDRDATIQEAYTLMRDEQVSRLPVVDEMQKLIGIISRFDIAILLEKPKQKPRFLSMSAEKESALQKPLSSLFKRTVVTASEDVPNHSILRLMIEQNVGSVIIIDKNRKPVGIVSSHDILKALGTLKPMKLLNIELHAPVEFIHQTQLTELINTFYDKINKSNPLQLITFNVKADKNAAGKVKRFEMTSQTTTKRGKTTHASDEGFDWKQTARNVLERMKKQLIDRE